ncbi:hypothetical protein ACIQWR_41220 [Streptomyces sp. NPDC098789]|uniref:hypothetical protein n=1 Tax=Streptomyces sp. NPDC098789 TaxID=3366098 RepID=UPI0037F97733
MVAEHSQASEEENKYDLTPPYQNDTWAATVRAPIETPLVPGAKDGQLEIILHNVGNKAKKLDTVVAFTYRTTSIPSIPNCNSPENKGKIFNNDKISGEFYSNHIPGDMVQIECKDINNGSPVEAHLDQNTNTKRWYWNYAPEGGWKIGKTYNVKITSFLEGVKSETQELEFSIKTNLPTIEVNQPTNNGSLLKDGKIQGSFGGVCDYVYVDTEHYGRLTARITGNSLWECAPPSGGWQEDRDETITCWGKNDSGETTKENRRTLKFTCRKPKPGAITFITPADDRQEYDTAENQLTLQIQATGAEVVLDYVEVTDEHQNNGKPMRAERQKEKVNDPAATYNLKEEWKEGESEPLEHVVKAVGVLAGGSVRTDAITRKFKVRRSGSTALNIELPKNNNPGVLPGDKEMRGLAPYSATKIAIEHTFNGKTKELARVDVVKDEKKRTATWEYKKTENWEIGDQSITVTAYSGNDKMKADPAINKFTVASAGPVFTQPASTTTATYPTAFKLCGRLPVDSGTKIKLDISGTIVEIETNEADKRSFAYTPPGGWKTGKYTVKATGYKKDGTEWDHHPEVSFEVKAWNQTFAITAPITDKVANFNTAVHVVLPADAENKIRLDVKNSKYKEWKNIYGDKKPDEGRPAWTNDSKPQPDNQGACDIPGWTNDPKVTNMYTVKGENTFRATCWVNGAKIIVERSYFYGK